MHISSDLKRNCHIQTETLPSAPRSGFTLDILFGSELLVAVAIDGFLWATYAYLFLAPGYRSKRLIRLPHPAADPGEAGLRRLIFVVDVERFRIRAGGLLLLPEPLIGKAAAGPGLGAHRVALHRLIEIARCRLVVADREVAQAARDELVGALRGEPERSGEIVDGELVLALALIEQAAAVIGLGIVGFQRDRLVEI